MKAPIGWPADSAGALYVKTPVTPEEIFRAIGRLRKEIDRLIRFLDESDNHMELGPEHDGDDADDEPSLGSFDRMTDQSKSWLKVDRNPDVYGWSHGVDNEQDDSDYEDADPNEAKQQPPEMTPCA
ncbi:hypothetical protein ACFIOY_36430 [Bradyrhizobium sp. TZ2]|jgi:hypothetical protein